MGLKEGEGEEGIFLWERTLSWQRSQRRKKGEVDTEHGGEWKKKTSEVSIERRVEECDSVSIRALQM